MNLKTRLIAFAKIIGVYAGYLLIGALIALMIRSLFASFKDTKFYGIIGGGIVLLFTMGYHILILKIFGKKDKPKHGLEFDKKWFVHFISSIGFAAILMLVIWGFAIVFRGFNVRANELNWEVVSLIIVLFIQMLFTGFQEEIITRGSLAYVGKSGGKYFSAIIISILFSFTHGAETFNIIFYLNLFLFSIIVFQLTWITGNIWSAVGFHFSWNFVMGGILGVAISGVNVKGILVSDLVNSKELINGGIYGLEGSIFCTVVLVIMVFLLFYIHWKKEKNITI
jgi:membrane protease YdiL (CAAX protease family)